MINSVIQIILSVFLIAIMAFISYSIYNNEVVNTITINSSTKKATNIFTGILDYSKEKNIHIETYDKTDPSYLDINPSINQNGGAEYSYNFWLFFDVLNGFISNEEADTNIPTLVRTTNKAYRYINLFYKGEYTQNIPVQPNNYDCTSNNDIKRLNENIFIKNPLIKIRNDAKEIIVEYNNINFPESYNSSSIKLDCNNTDITKVLDKRNKNKFGMKDINVDKYKQQFNMITVIFTEQSKNEYIFDKNSANCKMYFNGILIENRLAQTAALETSSSYNTIKSRVMKSNLSKLHINTNNTTIDKIDTSNGNIKMKISPLQVADLTYYNYALTLNEVKALYNKGFNKNIATFKSDTSKNFIYQKGKYIDNKDAATINGI
jgi:hypothetical protein